MNDQPVKIARTTCGKTIKVYYQVDDCQTFCIGAKYPELWKTIHRPANPMQAIEHCLDVNKLELLEVIK